MRLAEVLAPGAEREEMDAGGYEKESGEGDARSFSSAVEMTKGPRKVILRHEGCIARGRIEKPRKPFLATGA